MYASSNVQQGTKQDPAEIHCLYTLLWMAVFAVSVFMSDDESDIIPLSLLYIAYRVYILISCDMFIIFPLYLNIFPVISCEVPLY